MFPMHWEPLIRLKKSLNAAHKVGAVVLVDGAQSAFILILMCRKWIVIFLLFLLIKCMAQRVLVYCMAKKNLLEAMPVFQGGGEMIKEVTFEKTTYNDLPYKYEAGTPNIADTIAFKTALDFINATGKEKIREHEE